MESLVSKNQHQLGVMTSQHENRPNRTGLMRNSFVCTGSNLQGWFLTSCRGLGDLELTPERLPVVLVNEVVNALLDHVGLRTQRQDSPHSQVHRHRCSSAAQEMQPRSTRLREIIVFLQIRHGGKNKNKDHIRLHAFCLSCNVISMCDSNRDVIVRMKSAKLPKSPTADARL